ncbi:hypothetical protein [Nitrososphaera sp.]|uniref:hypothetical protein n=1 Tax=Nitrososphaera sp. TaxID=1971748 RepID=UPI002ED774F2
MTKILPYYIIYIVGIGVLPILAMALFVYADAISREYVGQIKGSVLLPVIAFLFLISTVPTKSEDYGKIGYVKAKKAHFTLNMIRRGWLSVFFLTLIIFVFQVALVFAASQSYFDVFPGPAWIPILSILSVFWYLLTHAVFGYWDKNEHFLLLMARGTCKTISEKQDGFEKVKLLILSLQWYERYASVALNLKHGNSEKIIAKILTESADRQAETIKVFFQAFTHNDPLEPLRELAKIGDITNSNGIQGRENSFSKLKNLEVILAVVASALAILIYFGNLFGR